MKLGQRVKTNYKFVNVPKGTEGVVDEIYDGGVMVAWDLPDRPLPGGWKYEGQWAMTPGVPLRDGFAENEWNMLEKIERQT